MSTTELVDALRLSRYPGMSMPKLPVLRLVAKEYLVVLVGVFLVTLVASHTFFSILSVYYGVIGVAEKVLLLSKSYMVYEATVIPSAANFWAMLDPVAFDEYVYNVSGGKSTAEITRSYVPPWLVEEVERIVGVGRVYRFYWFEVDVGGPSSTYSRYVPLLCGEGGVEAASAVLGPVRLVEGRWPRAPGEVVVSKVLADERGLGAGSTVMLVVFVAEEGHPMPLGKRAKAVGVELRVVGVYVSPRRQWGMYTMCQYLLPLLQERLGPQLGPWGYTVSRDTLWAPLLVIYLSDPARAGEAAAEIGVLLRSHNITLYTLFYDMPWLQVLAATTGSLRQSYTLLTAGGAAALLAAPLLAWVLAEKRRLRELVLLELLGLEPREVTIIHWLLYTTSYTAGAAVGMLLPTTSYQARLLLPQTLGIAELAQGTGSGHAALAYAILVVAGVAAAYATTALLVAKTRPGEALRYER